MCLSNLKNLVTVTRKVTFSLLPAQLSEQSLFTCTCYMHAPATSIEVTALCNVHCLFPVLLKLRKIKILKYWSPIFWPILCDCKVHFSFWQHCSSCNINFTSIATNNLTSKMNLYNSSRYIYTIQCGHCNNKKVVASENTWFIKQIDVRQYNHYIWFYWPDFPDDITR